MKNYLLTVLEHCSEENFGQEAVEWGIVQGHVTLTYHLETDVRAIMGAVCNRCHRPVEVDEQLNSEPHAHFAGNYFAACASSRTRDYTRLYDQFIEGYRRQTEEHGAALVAIYEASGILEEILRPVPARARELQCA